MNTALIVNYEKGGVIIDIGEFLTKIGFSGEHRPRHILSTQVLIQQSQLNICCTRLETSLLQIRKKKATTRLFSTSQRLSNSSGKRQFSTNSSSILHTILPTADEWIHVLTPFFQTIFDQYLLIQPSDRDFYIGENILTTNAFQKALYHVLVKKFKAQSLTFVPIMVVPIYLTGLCTGIVIDMGYTDIRIMPTYSGVALVTYSKSLSFGSRDINIKLQKMLLEAQSSLENSRIVESLTELEIEDIKQQICFVMFNLDNFKIDCSPPEEINVRNTTIKVPYDCCWKAYESIFGHDETLLSSISSSFIECLEECAIDIRLEVVQNIILCGGLAETPGFATRLAIELSQSIQSHNQLSFLNSFLRFFDSPFRASYHQWLGLSLHALYPGSKAMYNKDLVQMMNL